MQQPMLPEGTFTGRVAIVTGGGSGIGFSIAHTLATLGASLVIAGRRQPVLEDAATELRKTGAEVLVQAVDVRNPDQVQRMVDEAQQRFGRIDMLVNSAAGNFRVQAEDLSVNGWRAVTDIVLDGTWFCTQAVGRLMIAAGGGAILNIGTVSAFHGGPLAVHSACAKAGVLAMSRTLATEWGRHKIRVNVLTPGATADTGAVTQLFPTPEDQQRITLSVPLGRLAEREEIANTAVFLLSDYASYITGDNLVMDGGKWLGHGHLGSSFEPSSS
ncbi:SDR family oxidoreductase [Marinobacter vinifirmus]|nr:SDR family oxidoreductase [Marinobacter vinifirmus]